MRAPTYKQLDNTKRGRRDIRGEGGRGEGREGRERREGGRGRERGRGERRGREDGGERW